MTIIPPKLLMVVILIFRSPVCLPLPRSIYHTESEILPAIKKLTLYYKIYNNFLKIIHGRRENGCQGLKLKKRILWKMHSAIKKTVEKKQGYCQRFEKGALRETQHKKKEKSIGRRTAMKE